MRTRRCLTIQWMGDTHPTSYHNYFGYSGVKYVDNRNTPGYGPGPYSIGTGFVAGQVVVIDLFSGDGHTYHSGPASNNIDNFIHAFLI